MRLLISLLPFALLLCALGVLAALARHAWPRLRATTVELAGDAVARVVTPAVVLSPLELQRRMVRIGVASASVSVTGERYLSKTIAIEVAPDDHVRLASEVEGGLERVRRDVASEICTRGVQRGVSVPTGCSVDIRPSSFVRPGRPRVVTVAFDGPADPAAGDLPAPAVDALDRRPTPPVADGGLTHRTGVAPTPTRAASAPVIPTRAAPAPTAVPAPLAPGPAVETHLLDRCELVDLGGGEVIRLSRRSTTVGRGQGDIELDSDLVSVRHAELQCSAGVWRVRDLGSTNGTWVNARRVDEAEIASGDRISFGEHGPAFVFARSAGAAGEVAESRGGAGTATGAAR